MLWLKSLLHSISHMKPDKDKSHLLYGLVGGEIVLEGFGPLTVSQHDVVGDGGSSAAFGLDVGPVLCGQVEPHHQVTLWDIHTLLHNAGGYQQVGFMSTEFTQDLSVKKEANRFFFFLCVLWAIP